MAENPAARFEARFRVIARERLAALERSVADLVEEGGPSPDTARDVRGYLHTLKGEARVTGFAAIARIAHHLEECLGEDGALDGPALASFLEGITTIGELLALAPDAGEERAAAFEARANGGASPEPAPSPAPAVPGAPTALALPRTEDFVRVDLASLARLTRASGELRLAERELTELLATLQGVVEDVALSQTRARRAAKHEPRAAPSVELLSRLRRVLDRGRQVAFDHHLRLESLGDRIRDLRLVALASVFEPFPRAVRQLAGQLGKQVELQVEGMDVQVDKHVLDVLADPLLHLVRNAVDHGIEAPDARERQGKQACGRIMLRGRSSGSMVCVDVEDDGRGVDVEAVRAALRVRGAIHVDQLELDDLELLDQLCLAGLSTREHVSEISGRGIGLDVVRRRTESIGGQLHLYTRSGEGTRFTLEVPTSAVLGAMIGVDVDGSRYAFAPHEVDRVLARDEAEIGVAGRGLSLRAGDRTIGLYDLGALLEGRASDPSERAAVLVLRHAERRIAVGIDRSHGMSSVLQQRLDPFLEGVPVIRSVALLGTGELAIVLDVPELLRRAEGEDRAVSSRPAQPGAERPRVLVVDDSELTRDVVTGVLRDLGLDVIEAVNGRQALERIEAKRPQLVLTDLDMPVLDGFGLLRQIRATPGRETLPVVVVSTRGEQKDVQRASELGADAYLVKSGLDFDELRRVVRRYLEVRA